MNENERIVYRSHFSVLITKATGVLAALAVIIVTNLRDAESLFRELRTTGGIPARYCPVLLGLLVMVLFLAALAVRRWWRTYIILDGTNLIVHRATMVDKQNIIDLATVSSVNLEQNLLQMVLGVYRIRIDTNSASTAEDTDVDLVLARDRAEEFKRLVMGRMGAESPVPVDPQELYHSGISFGTGAVLRHAMFSSSIAGLLIGVGGLALGSGMLADDIHGIDTSSLGEFLTSLVVLLVAIWSLVGTPVKSFLRLYDFRCMRHGDSLRLAYGLTRRRDFSVPVSKIHAVTVNQGFLARIFGYEELKISVIGMGDDDDEVCNLSLYLRRDKITSLVSRLLPEYEQLYQMKWERKRAILMAIDAVRYVLISSAVMAVAWLVIPLSLNWKLMIAAGVPVAAAVFSVSAGVTAGLALAENGVVIRGGIFDATRTLVFYKKLQTMRYDGGPIWRHFGVSEGVLTMFGGIFGSRISVGAFPTVRFEEIARRMCAARCYSPRSSA